ncbi:uncharacterized protein ASPGLDRAFT_93062, partial [Aspergillus glaucus CBS 516.65]
FYNSCLKRDTHHCVVTRFMEYYYWHAKGEPEDEYFDDLEAVHIIPSAYESWRADAMMTWEALYRCFPAACRVGMHMDNINHISNDISMIPGMHAQFGQFRMSLSPRRVYTSIFNRHGITICRAFPTLYHDLPADRLITFKTKINFFFPDPMLLDTHFRVAEILSASGMGEVISQ